MKEFKAAGYFYCMNEGQPLKRSVELQAISREHHDGLLFVWKIRQGLDNHTSIEKLKEYTGWYWRNHIKSHFYQEEKILLPYFPAMHPMALKLKKEHDYIRELILEIDKEADRHDIIRLVDFIESHIRFEEREFFQYLEEHLTKQDMTDVYGQLVKHPVISDEANATQGWKDPFWLK